MRKLLLALAVLCGTVSGWAQKLVTSVQEGKYYTLECNSGEAHSTTRFLGENAYGLNGQSAKPTYLAFEATTGGYFVKSSLTGMYLNQGESLGGDKYAVAYSKDAATVWTVGKLADDATDIYLTIGDSKLYLNNNSENAQKLQIVKHDPIGTNRACSLWEMREHEGGYKVIESIGDNITELNQLTDGSYVVFYNVGRKKYIYEGLEYKLWMGTEASVDAGHEYIFRVRKEGEKYAFMSVSGRYISSPLDGSDVFTFGIDNSAKDEVTIEKHNEDNTKWKLKSTNIDKYWDAQDARFVGWQGSGTNSRYEIKPVTVKESEHALAQYITTDENIIKWVNIKNLRAGKYAHYEGESTKMTLKNDDTSSKSYFYLTGKIGANGPVVKIHNYRTESLCNETSSWTTGGREWTIQSSNGQGHHPGLAITKGTDLGNDGLSWNNEGGGGEYIAYWNGNDQGSTWEFTLASYPALLQRLNDLKAAVLSPAIANAQSAYEAGEYTKTPVTLTVEQLYCNAPYTAKNNGDNLGVGALIDGNDNTYLHTDYSGDRSADDLDHYIRVDLGESSAIKYFTFNYKTRHNADGNNPRVIVVEGCDTENGEYSEIATLTESDGLPITGNGAVYESPALGGHVYRYIRFRVTDTNNHSEGAGHKFFSLASFGISKVTVKEGSEVKTLVYYNLPEAIAEAETVLATLRTTEDEINRVATNLNTRISGLVVQNYPFTLTTDVNHPVCYFIKSARSKEWSGNYYWTFENGKVTTIVSNDEYTKDVEAYWFFMEDPQNGQLKLVPFIEHLKPMGYTTVANGKDKLTNNTAASGFAGSIYTFVTNAEGNWASYPYALRPYGVDNYVSNCNGNDGHYMGFWNSLDDHGTRFNLERAEITPSALLRDLRDALAPCPDIPANQAGTAIGLYNAENHAIYTNIITNARAAYNDATLPESDYVPHLVALDNDPKSLLVINTPEVGKFYRLKNAVSGNYMCGNVSNITVQTAEGDANGGENRPATIFYLGENNTLLSYSTGLYLDCYAKGYAGVGTSKNGTFAPAFGGCQENVIAYSTDGCWLYGNSATNTQINKNTATLPTDKGNNWIFEEVTYLPVKVSSTLKFGTLYSPVALSTTEQWSKNKIKAYTGVVNDDRLVLSEISGDIPANTPVIVEYVGGEQTYDCSYLKVIASAEPVTATNELRGEIADAYKEGDAYVLANTDENGVGFYKAKLNFTVAGNGTGTKVTEGGTHFLNNGFKAYLPANAVTTADARFLVFDFGGTETGIDELKGENGNVKAEVYDLAGRRVLNAKKGVFVVNGKVIVK